MLDQHQIAAASRTLHDHWRAGTKLSNLEAPQRPHDRAEGHAIQGRIESYSAGKLFGWKIAATLGGSGHNAGTVNPPAANKHGYWTNPELSTDAENWLRGAKRHEGSWWPEWAAWLKQHGDEEAAARVVSGGPFPVLEAAPGSYVKVRR